MGLRSRKRMASQILKVGITRVRFDPERLDEIEDAITKDGIRGLIREGAIWAVKTKGVSRGRALGIRGRGPGSRKGALGSRRGKKEAWVRSVRAVRRYLRVAREKGYITSPVFDELYVQIKGGQVRSVRHLKELIRLKGRR